MIDEINEIIKIRHSGWKKTPTLPYAIYEKDIQTDSDDSSIKRIKTTNYEISLYTNSLDEEIELEIEKILNKYCTEYSKNQVWNFENENWITYYNFEIIEKEKIK